MEAIRRLEQKFDRASIGRLLAINSGFFCFVLLPHGGPLILSRTSAWRGPVPDPSLAYVTVPITLAALLATLVAALRPSVAPAVLKAHAILLLAGAVTLTGFGMWLAAVGAPPGVPVVWNPLFFAFSVAYPPLLARRAFNIKSAVWQHAPVAAVAISVAVSAAVYWRILGT